LNYKDIAVNIKYTIYAKNRINSPKVFLRVTDGIIQKLRNPKT